MFSQVAGYKPNIQNPVAFLHSVPNTEKETRSDPSTVATHTNQMPENNQPRKRKTSTILRDLKILRH